MPKPLSYAACAIAVSLLVFCNSNVQGAPLTLVPDLFTEGAVTTIYDPSSGNLSLNSSVGITTFEVTSASGKFIPAAAKSGVIQPPFDVLTESKWFKLDTTGFTNVDFGPIYPAGMDIDDLQADLSVRGSLLGGGPLDRDVATSPHLFIVPEPSSAILLGLGALAILGIRRKA